jgi:hypothetical protein
VSRLLAQRNDGPNRLSSFSLATPANEIKCHLTIAVGRSADERRISRRSVMRSAIFPKAGLEIENNALRSVDQEAVDGWPGGEPKWVIDQSP